MKFTISNVISVDRNDLPRLVQAKCEERLVFPNPKWISNEEHGYWQNDTPRILRYIHAKGDAIQMPRGFIHQLLNILRHNNVSYEIIDQTRALPEVPFDFRGELHPFQKDAVSAVLSRRFGVVQIPPGGGKTILTLSAIAERQQPSLVVVHRKELLDQWVVRANEFLRLESGEIGIIGAGKKIIGDRLTIGLVNSLRKCITEVRDRVGFLVIDECHRTPAKTFTEVVRWFDSKYMLGLSATAFRRDGLTRLIYSHIGDLIYKIEPRELQDQQHIMRPELVVIKTGVSYNYTCDADYQPMIRALVDSSYRNGLIAQVVLGEVEDGTGIALCLSDRVRHCETLLSILNAGGVEARMLIGNMTTKARQRVVEELQGGSVRVLVSTFQLISEGFDLPALSSVFLATPITFTGRVIQSVGRVLRVAEGKSAPKIYDFVDDVGVLRASFQTRCAAYRKLGVEIPEEAV